MIEGGLYFYKSNDLLWKFDALKSLVRGSCNCKLVTDSYVVLEVAINLHTTIYEFADDLDVLANALCSPSALSWIVHESLPHEVVEVVLVVGEDVRAAYQARNGVRVELVLLLRIRVVACFAYYRFDHLHL